MLAGRLKSFQTPVFGLRSIDWPGCVTSTVGWSRVVGASADRTLFPTVDDVEDKGGVHGDCWVQRRRQPSGAISYARYRLSRLARGSERHSAPIACNHVTGFRREPRQLHLHSLER